MKAQPAKHHLLPASLLLAALAGPAWGDDQERQAQAEAYWLPRTLAPIERTPEGSWKTGPIPFPDAQRNQVLRIIASLEIEAFLNTGFDAQLPPFAWGEVKDLNGLIGAEPPLQPQFKPTPLPAWIEEAIRKRLHALSFAGTTTRRPAGRTKLVWVRTSPRHEESRADAMPIAGAAMAWAGPAVRDDKAAYHVQDGRTTIRIDSSPYPAADLVGWARVTGAAVTFTLPENVEGIFSGEELPVVIGLTVPVWLVTPQGLVAATLNRFHKGNLCRQGGWLEIDIAGEAKPAIWGLLFLPDASLARTAVVRRITPEAAADHASHAQHQQLELSWPDQKLPALNFHAKRYDWASYRQTGEEKPAILGSAWGTYVELKSGAKPYERLSAAGSPECEPR